MGRHTQYLRLKLRNKTGSIVSNGTTNVVNRLKKGQYKKGLNRKPWICIVCKYKNNQSSFACHGIGCKMINEEILESRKK